MGRNSNTHVANASGHDIYVNVSKDRMYVKSFNASASGGGVNISGGATYDWQLVDKSGLSLVTPRNYKNFHVGGGNDGEVYLTILIQTPDGRLKVLDHVRPVNEDISWIVTRDGEVKKSRYGHIWEEA